MKIIIGAGCVGLSIAYNLLEKYKSADDIVIIDKYNIPTRGTSLRNSGVLHAGLYYPKGTEKSKLCIKGGESLSRLCKDNNLPILNCGKLIVPFNRKDEENLENLYLNAKNCGRTVEVINYREAANIQPHIRNVNKYLWSPKTSVFEPNKVLNFFYRKLVDAGAKFLVDSVDEIDFENLCVRTKNSGNFKYTFLFNCAGPGALELANKKNNFYKNLTVLPILGQYGIIPKKNYLKTNIYPVPDPNLPFLGIHITPLTNGNILIGPNAIPIFNKDVQGQELSDWISLFPNLFYHSRLFLSNSQNYRTHALNELTFRFIIKFKEETSKFLDFPDRSIDEMFMSTENYGIRPQLYDKKKNKLVDDFMYDIDENSINIVNAVSPAFTSCLALSEKIINAISN